MSTKIILAQYTVSPRSLDHFYFVETYFIKNWPRRLGHTVVTWKTTLFSLATNILEGGFFWNVSLQMLSNHRLILEKSIYLITMNFFHKYLVFIHCYTHLVLVFSLTSFSCFLKMFVSESILVLCVLFLLVYVCFHRVHWVHWFPYLFVIDVLLIANK